MKAKDLKPGMRVSFQPSKFRRYDAIVIDPKVTHEIVTRTRRTAEGVWERYTVQVAAKPGTVAVAQRYGNSWVPQYVKTWQIPCTMEVQAERNEQARQERIAREDALRQSRLATDAAVEQVAKALAKLGVGSHRVTGYSAGTVEIRLSPATAMDLAALLSKEA